MQLAPDLADRVFVLHDGKELAVGAPDDVLSDPRVVQAYIGAQHKVRFMKIDVSRMRSTPEGYFTTRWGQPEYTDWIDETNSWKEACYIGDWSFLWERRFEGQDALKLFSDISVNSFT